MADRIEQISISQFQEMIELFQSSMDDYLYIYDLVNDFYCISSSACRRFNIPDEKFYHVKEVFRGLVHAEDYGTLMEDLDRASRGEADFHNLEYRWLDREGNAIWINCRGRIIKNYDGSARYLLGCINEIGKDQKADNVSGLLRESSLHHEIAQKQSGSMKGFMLRFGIDHLRDINENKGLDYGDMVLRMTAECIKECLTDGQKLYRVISDEFMVVDFASRDLHEAVGLYKKVRAGIDKIIEENGYEVFYTISAGLLELELVEEQSYTNLMKLSEFALQEAKSRGRNQCYTYVREDYDNFRRKRRLIHLMRQAVNDDFEGFEAYFQPIVDIGENKLCGAETLLRFRTDETGAVSPVEFIPMLEESGLIIPVGRWVLEQAMVACNKFREKIPDFRVSVNLSYIQILKSNVLAEIKEGMERHSLPPGSIIVELTESGMLETSSGFQKFCEGLKENAISLALDDFGTGYSNFTYLYQLSPDTIKIDRTFTLKALQSEEEYNILKHMVDMSHGISLKLCIEGIETEEELAKINQMKPDYIQGYYFGKPCPFEQFVKEHIIQKKTGA